MRGAIADSNRRMENRVGRLEREALKHAKCRVYSGSRTTLFLNQLEAGIRQAQRNAAATRQALRLANARAR
jgi:hypothetical protein